MFMGNTRLPQLNYEHHSLETMTEPFSFAVTIAVLAISAVAFRVVFILGEISD